MRKTTLPTFGRFTALFTTLLLAGCGLELGSGRMVEDQRTVAAFKRLSIHDGIHAEVTPGERSVALTADDNLLPLVETFVEGETLVVRVKPLAEVRSLTGLRVVVRNPELLAVSASGGSQVTAVATPAERWLVDASGGSRVSLTQLATARLDVTASGGSQVTLAGSATELDVHASGASRVLAEGTASEGVTLDGSGASVLEARATASARGHLSGGSTATITGAPAVRDISTSGDSAVSWR